jgi:hypothetical protein
LDEQGIKVANLLLQPIPRRKLLLCEPVGEFNARALLVGKTILSQHALLATLGVQSHHCVAIGLKAQIYAVSGYRGVI